ncbi:MAG: hypothetical protein CENE_01477 [Candidatus Celerinatantimonas neptuna]|nr:MAG: hypothetical protein CENE_01477 [Candidatus Celerinatantimonas neptuna]
MIELQLSADVPSLLPRVSHHFQSPLGWQWSGHSCRVLEHDCLLLLEHQSHYMMLFVDLNMSDYEAFQQVWQRRLVAEALTIADLDPVDGCDLQVELLGRSEHLLVTDGKPLAKMVALSEVEYGLSVLAKQYGRLPVDESEEFRWGVVLNQARSYHGYSPYRLFADVCRQLIQEELVSLDPMVLH